MDPAFGILQLYAKDPAKLYTLLVRLIVSFLIPLQLPPE